MVSSNLINPPWHLPVMASQVRSFLITDPTGVYVDATLGDGGHTMEIAQELESGGKILGLDRDLAATERARHRLSEVSHIPITIEHSESHQMVEVAHKMGIDAVTGILLDLGISSRQLDDPDLGFSYRFDGPLDMRMDRNQSLTAHDVVNDWDERELAKIFREYGEEPAARRIAGAIVRNRPVSGTAELRRIVQGQIGPRKPQPVLSRVFQALRIVVNGEMEQLEMSLKGAIGLLTKGGRLVVLAYHSLEDRAVKNMFRLESRDCICPKEVPICQCGHVATVKLLTRKPMRPDAQEIAGNKRARSALLRAVERV